MKFLLYSGGATAANKRLHGALADLAGARRRMSLTYVPFCAAGSLPFFKRFQRRYAPYGFTDCHCFPIDTPYSAEALERALASDAIYLAGGNTYYFLHHLRRQGLLQKLRDFAARGGVLAGLSAGAIILTPNIGLAGYPPFDADRNEIGLKNLRALALVPFEFFPHYHARAKLRSALAGYSRESRCPIVAAADGGGVVIAGEHMTFIGRVELFLGGSNARLSV